MKFSHFVGVYKQDGEGGTMWMTVQLDEHIFK